MRCPDVRGPDEVAQHECGVIVVERALIVRTADFWRVVRMRSADRAILTS